MSRAVRRALLAAGLGAACALAALPVHWVTQTYGSDHSGRLFLTGSGAAPAVLPAVLVAVAGVVAALSVGGLWCRVIAAVAGLSGLGVGAAAVTFLARPPAQAVATGAAAPAPADLLDPVVVHPLGPVLALVGGVLLALSGGVLAAAPPPRRLRGRFERRPDPSDPSAAAGAPDTWWAALDDGADPTAVSASGPPPGPPSAPRESESGQ